MARISPVQGKPALIVGGRTRMLCVADIHLGYEIELREAGFNVPDQTEEIIESLVGIEEGDRLLILGDLKHTITSTSDHEFEGFTRFFKAVDDRFSSTILVSGNHDGWIEKSLPGSVRVERSQGFAESSIGFAHGHSWPSPEVMESPRLVMGHLHPSIRMRDKLGASHSIKVWLRGKAFPESVRSRYPSVGVKETVIMPSFNHLLTGTPVNEKAGKTLGPLIRSGFVRIDEMHAYSIEGIDLGLVGQLRPGKK